MTEPVRLAKRVAELRPCSRREAEQLITGGWVHYFDMKWSLPHDKAEPLTFGTVKSRLRQVLDAGHEGVQLTRDEMHRVKCWIDLNCPLWPDYTQRELRPGLAKAPVDKQ